MKLLEILHRFLFRMYSNRLAKLISESFDDVNWRTQSFNINGNPLEIDGEDRFYQKGEIDKAIHRLNRILRVLEK